MINQLLWLDHSVFEWIQIHLHNDLINNFIIGFRDKMFWVPLYITLIGWIFLFHKKTVWIIVLCTIVLIALTDQLNSNILKKAIKRDRPCRELYFKDHFSPLIDCSGGYSFPSTHAANHMALGLFFFFILRDSLPKARYFMLFWPILIGFAQVFVGVHFPIDVIAGWLVGLITGSLVYFLFKKILSNYGFGGTN
ncbi:MAG: phosphatase PAP2 family protein [Saprospiraceae bacterium]